MKQLNRRHFIQRTAIAAGASFAPALNALGANEKLIIGIIGPGGMGMHHLSAFSGYKDVEIAYVCDPDERRRRTASSEVEKRSGKAPKIRSRHASIV